MNSYKKLLKNSSIFAIANLGTKLISIVLVPLYTYVLTTEQYGSIDLIITTISLLIPIITISIFNSVLRFTMDPNCNKKEILNSSIRVSIIGYTILLVLYPVLKKINFISENINLFYIILCIQSFNSILSNFTRAIDKVKIFAFNGILNTSVMISLNIILIVKFNMGIKGYLISIIIAEFISCIYLLYFGKLIKFFDFNSYNKTLTKQMLKYSIPLIPNSMMWWIMNVSDRYMIGLILGIESNGLYAIANKIPSLLNIANSIFFQAWQLSAIEESNNKYKSNIYSNVFNVFSTTMILGTSFIVIFIKFIMKSFVNIEFYNAWKAAPFLLLSTVFSSFSSFLGTNYIAMKKTEGIFKTSLIGAIINIILNIILIPIIGLVGAALSTMFSFLCVWIIRHYKTKTFVNININLWIFIPSYIIIFIQILTLYMNLKREFFIQIILFFTIVVINRNNVCQILRKVKNVYK